MRLIGKLIYLTVIRPNIIFAVGVLSRFMHQPRKTHWIVAIRVLVYIKRCPGKRLYIGNMDMYAFLNTQIQDMLVTEEIGCTFVGENLITWRS